MREDAFRPVQGGDQRGGYAVPVKLFMSEVVYEGDMKMVQACNLSCYNELDRIKLKDQDGHNKMGLQGRGYKPSLGGFRPPVSLCFVSLAPCLKEFLAEESWACDLYRSWRQWLNSKPCLMGKTWDQLQSGKCYSSHEETALCWKESFSFDL